MNSTREKLETAAQGLLFISESEAPLTFFEAPDQTGLNEEFSLKLAGKPAGTPVEKTDVDYFFRNMVKVYPGAAPEEEASAAKFKKLVQALKEELSEPVVYRVGTRQIDAFIAGKTKDGTIAGLRTRLIET